MVKLREDQRREKKRPKREDDEPNDVREAVEEQDRDRARRMEEWEKRYGDLLKSQDGHGRDETPVTPFLLIRYANIDGGARPITSATRFWETPFIWVESSDPYGNAVAGEQNFLHALIFNGGAFQAAPVKVDFYWANPALGLGPANMNYVGTEWVEIPRLGSKDVRCPTPWVPVVVNNGHECVMVNSSCALSDPILHPFQPTLDRHVGQKNLHVVAGKAGQKLLYTLQVTNIFPIEMPALITAQFTQLMLTREDHNIPLHQLGGFAATFSMREKTSHFRLTDTYVRDSPAHRIAQRGAALERRATIPASIPFKPLRGRGMAVTVDARGPRGTIQSGEMGRYTGDLFAALDMFREGRGGNPEGVVIEKLHLDAFSFQTIEVQVDVPADAEAGQIFVTHLSHYAGPLTVGGYSMVVVIQ
jgi:hypothetical protein